MEIRRVSGSKWAFANGFVLVVAVAALWPKLATAAWFTEYATLPLTVPETDKLGDPIGRTKSVGGDAVAVLDANGDGLDDLVVVTGDPYYHVILNSRDAGGGYAFTVQPPTYIGVTGDQKKNGPQGLGLHDFDDDGLLDLYLGNSGRGGVRLKAPRAPFSLAPENLIDSGLYRDAGYRTHLSRGDGTFAHQDLGVDGDGTTRSSVFADFDGDGYTDAFLSNAPYFGIWWGGSSAPNQLRPGLPDGTFGANMIETAVINDPGDLWQDALGRASNDFKGIVVRDFDKDGRPDVILGAFADIWDNVMTPPIWVTDPSGALVDADADGLPDGGYQGDWKRGALVLRNVSTPGRIRFEDVSASAIDVALGLTDQMHVYVTVPADIDNDGDLDLLCSGVRYHAAHNAYLFNTDRVRVYRNDSSPGRIVFTNVTATSGVAFMNDDAAVAAFSNGTYPASIPGVMLDGGDLTLTPMLLAGAAVDIDNDGDVDWVAVDRQLFSRDPMTGKQFSGWVFVNDGQGHFAAVSSSEHGLVRTSRELSYGDFNEDGRVDLVMSDDSGGGQTVDNNNYVFVNSIDNGNHWVRISVAAPGNRLGLGTKVTVYAAGTSTILGYEELRTDFGYRSKRPASLHFGLGGAERVDIRMVLADGTSSVHRGLAADRAYHLRAGDRVAWRRGAGGLGRIRHHVEGTCSSTMRKRKPG